MDIQVLKTCIENKDEEGIKDFILPLHPSDIAKALTELEDTEQIIVFKFLPAEIASDVLLEVDEHTRERLISSISDKELIEVLAEMETDDAADVIAELPEDDAETVLDGISREEGVEVRKLLKYPEDSAGGIMQTELVSVSEDATVQETIEQVRAKSEDVPNIHNVFVTDNDGRFKGTVSLDKLILAKPHLSVHDIMNQETVRVTVDTDQEDVAKIFQKYDVVTLPVIDADGKLLGRITIDDVVDVVEEEIFEDFYKMAGLNTDERVLDPPSRSFKLRAPWLLLNLATAFLAASVVKVFEGTIQTVVTLAVFMPVVAGMGGNAATQTITVVVRGLALGELEFRHAKRVLLNQVIVGFANGILTGTAAVIVAHLFGISYTIGILLFLAMITNMIIAGFSGTVIPLILKWFKADPALSSAVFVTTCTDVGGFFSFLGLATLFLKYGYL
ncbi:MAG: magnesium transporter [Deltaproteobacteria bacterium GWC2_42_11]|nr:MAG: magnesium transporter [Deltaproteobacteria bacterium GWC2_42_11]HBO84307.1 magnesium transporter [Deltaproteobacteria bacterium]